MAVEYASTFTTKGSKAALSVLANNNLSIALTPFSVGTQTNQLLILAVFSLNRDVGTLPDNEDPASVTSIDITGASPGTFELIGADTFRNQPLIGDTIKITFYAVRNPNTVTNITVTVNMDRKSEVLGAYICAYRNCYQGAVPTIIKTDDIAAAVDLASFFPDPDPNGAIVSQMINYANILGGDSGYTAISGQTTRTSSASWTTKDSGNGFTGTTDGHGSSQFDDIIGPSTDQSVGYTLDSASNTAACVMSVEIKPDDWQPLTSPISGEVICPYVSQGQVRKLVQNISGADHLDGEDVAIQADGVPILDSDGSPKLYSVDSGSLTSNLDNYHAVIHLGLPYNGKVKFLKLSDGSARGTGQFKMRRIYLADVRVYRSMSFKIGLDETNIDPVKLSSPALPLWTEDIKKFPNTGWGDQENLHIIQDIPAPVFILAVKMESEVEEAD